MGFFLDAIAANFAEKHCIKRNLKGSYLLYDTLMNTGILAVLLLYTLLMGDTTLPLYLLCIVIAAALMFCWALFTSRFVIPSEKKGNAPPPRGGKEKGKRSLHKKSMKKENQRLGRLATATLGAGFLRGDFFAAIRLFDPIVYDAVRAFGAKPARSQRP